MKKSLLALAVLAAGAAQAQSSVTLYGVADVGYNSDVKKSSTGAKSEASDIITNGMLTSRIGLMSAKPRDLRKLVDGINSSAQLSTLLEQAGIHHEQAGLLAMLMQQLPAQLPAVQSVAELIERACTKVLSSGLRTADIMQPGMARVSTQVMGEAVTRELDKIAA